MSHFFTLVLVPEGTSDRSGLELKHTAMIGGCNSYEIQ